MPKLFNLRTDPFERADTTSNTYWDWYMSKAYLILAAQALVGRVPRDVQGVPAAAEGGELHDRPGPREDGGRGERGARLMPSCSPRGTTRRRTEAIVALRRGGAHRTVPPEERVAVFDNDGTLWCEKPMPVELGFILERLAAMAEADESLRDEAAVEGRVREGLRLARAA